MLPMLFKRTIPAILVVTMIAALSGCATNGQPLTTEQKIGRCVGGVIGLTIACRLIGDQKLAKQCAVAALATCAVWLVYNNAQDKKRIADAQQRALETGQAQQDQWVNDGDGNARAVTVSLRPDQIGTGGQLCRTMDIEATAVGTEGVGKNTVTSCRTPEGDWVVQTTNV